jgi:amidohydrolase
LSSSCDHNEMIDSDLVAEAVSWRRHLHKHPELAFQERQTSEFVAAQLTRFGLKVHHGLAGTGVVGTLTRGTSRRSIAIRADMDALPIQEQSGALHASCTPGVMHACGHDGHVAMALAAARACAALPDLDGTVHFVFQPAEEAQGGARVMIEEGLFRLFPCDAVYALHNWPDQPLGTCVARDDAMMAALALFEIVVNGRSCHAAMPHEGSDCIVASCQLVSALQTVVSRNTDPLKSAVLSVTQIHAGDTWNALPNSCVIRGTTRCFDPAVGDFIEHRLTELSESIARAFSCDQHLKYERTFPATVNDPTAARRVRTLAASSPLKFAVIEAQPSMASEDFAFMLQAVPGCYFWLGTGGRPIRHNLHSSSFDFNDDVLPLGIALWVALVKSSLASA